MALAAKEKGRQDPVSQAFGDRVRALRERESLTLDRLSVLSGVSKAMLSKVERGEKSPTIGIAKRIAHALDSSLSALMGDDAAPQRAFAVVRKDERPVFWDPDTGFERFLLSPMMAGMPVEVVLHRLPPQTGTGPLPAYPGGTSKHVLAVRGKLAVVVEGSETILDEGDTLYFQADVEHSFENRMTRPAEYYLVICADAAFRRPAGTG